MYIDCMNEEQAYGMFNWEEILQVMRRYGVGGKLFNSSSSIDANSLTFIRVKVLRVGL